MNRKPEPKTCTCQLCGKEVTTTISDEEAMQEMKQNFGDFKEEDSVVVCDDCLRLLLSVVNL